MYIVGVGAKFLKYMYVLNAFILRFYHLRFLYGIKTSFELPTTTKAILTITHNLYNHSFMYCFVYVHKNASGIQHIYYRSVVDEKIKLPSYTLNPRCVQSCNVMYQDQATNTAEV